MVSGGRRGIDFNSFCSNIRSCIDGVIFHTRHSLSFLQRQLGLRNTNKPCEVPGTASNMEVHIMIDVKPVILFRSSKNRHGESERGGAILLLQVAGLYCHKC